MFLLILLLKGSLLPSYKTLHSTMFLLIPGILLIIISPCSTLHSTMFLLILCSLPSVICRKYSFTFHNVSINTLSVRSVHAQHHSLHSTMFLLIPSNPTTIPSIKYAFTFHNVSINTAVRRSWRRRLFLYIPQCFY